MHRIDKDFIAASTHDFDKALAANKTSVDEAAKITGLKPEDIIKAAEWIAMPKEGGKRLSITADKLAAGIDLAEALKLSQDSKSADAFKRIEEKHRVLDLAWLTHVGHKRPDTPKGIALAEAQKKAAALDADVRLLCAPIETSMGVGPQ